MRGMLLFLEHRLTLLGQFAHGIKQCKMPRRSSPVDAQRLSGPATDRRLRLTVIGLLLLLLLSSLLLSEHGTLCCFKSLVVRSEILGL